MIRKRRVVFVIPGLQGGGAERVAMTLLQRLDRERLDLTIVVVNLNDSVFASELPADVTLVNLSVTRLRYAIFRLLRYIRRADPDVVVSFIDHMNLALLPLRPFWKKAALVQYMTSAFSFRHWVWRLTMFLLGGNVQALVFQSNEMKALYPDRLRDHAAVIYNPVDTLKIKRSASQISEPLYERGPFNLVASGRLHPIKGFDILISAIHEMNDPEIRLAILGDGPERAALETQIATLGIGHQIRLLGFKENPYPYYFQADAMVLSSRQEGLPNVVLEALALGTPVIATPVSSIREILGDLAGCHIATECSVAGLCDAIRQALPERGIRIPPGATYKFEADTISAQYSELFLAV